MNFEIEFRPQSWIQNLKKKIFQQEISKRKKDLQTGRAKFYIVILAWPNLVAWPELGRVWHMPFNTNLNSMCQSPVKRFITFFLYLFIVMCEFYTLLVEIFVRLAIRPVKRPPDRSTNFFFFLKFLVEKKFSRIFFSSFVFNFARIL